MTMNLHQGAASARPSRSHLGLVALAWLIAASSVGACQGSSLEEREESELMDPITDKSLDREEGEGTGIRRAEKNVFLPEVKATASLRPTEGNEARGELEFGPAEQGVQLVGSVVGLRPAGVHAIHIHEKGDCSAPDASSAGDHFNPDDEPHGRAFHGAHHVGDMDNIKANIDGEAGVERMIVGATLGDGGPNDIAGRSVVVHVSADGYTSQPSGGAGDRIACGVIELKKN
jgi:superoxide dismutase, Cu-Zn family